MHVLGTRAAELPDHRRLCDLAGHAEPAFPLSPCPSQSRVIPITSASGYFTSNNVKTDYNLANEAAFIRASWDRCDATAHWRQRKAGQPFFSVFNILDTHQWRRNVETFEWFEEHIGSKLAAAQRHDPAKARVPPYYPDTPLVRRTLARTADCVTSMDKRVAELLKELDNSLAGDTIVFFYADEGAGIPHGKRTNYDSGLRVPLLIRFPDKFRQLAPAAAGAATDRMVSFVDFAPRCSAWPACPPSGICRARRSLARRPASRKNTLARPTASMVQFLSRAVHDARWLYIRNYLPHLSWMPPESAPINP